MNELKFVVRTAETVEGSPIVVVEQRSKDSFVSWQIYAKNMDATSLMAKFVADLHKLIEGFQNQKLPGGEENGSPSEQQRSHESSISPSLESLQTEPVLGYQWAVGWPMS